jgi:hypothetical protein
VPVRRRWAFQSGFPVLRPITLPMNPPIPVHHPCSTSCSTIRHIQATTRAPDAEHVIHVVRQEICAHVTGHAVRKPFCCMRLTAQRRIESQKFVETTMSYGSPPARTEDGRTKEPTESSTEPANTFKALGSFSIGPSWVPEELPEDSSLRRLASCINYCTIACTTRSFDVSRSSPPW